MIFELKNINKKTPRIGLGAMRFPTVSNNPNKTDKNKAIELIRFSYDLGVRYFDTAQNYLFNESENIVGEAVKDFRDEVIIATKVGIWHVPNENIEDVEKLFESQLERLQTDYIDMYMIHALTDARWEIFEKIGIVDFFEKKKSEGKIKSFGFSYHGTSFLFKKIIKKYKWDFVQLQINYIDTDIQATLEGLYFAKTLGINTIIMEPLRGGQLIKNLPKEVQTLFKQEFPNKSFAELGLAWLLNKSEVDLVISGMNEKEHIQENISIEGKYIPNQMNSVELEIYSKAKDIFNKGTKVKCTMCRYCLPCPKGIDIPRVFDLYNFAAHTSFEKGKEWYKKKYANSITECCKCSICSNLCPQDIDIPKKLNELKSFFNNI